MLRPLPIIAVLAGLGGACTPGLIQSSSYPLISAVEPVQADASAIAYVIQAERYSIQERFQEAADHYRLALVHDPYSADLHLRLAQSLGKLNRWFAALEVLEKALVAQPEHTQLQLALGRLYLEIEDYESAEKVLEQIGPDKSEFQSAWVMRFESALWSGRPALIQSVRTQGLAEFPDMMCVVARLLEDHGKDAQARRDYERCAEPSELDVLRLDFREKGGELLYRFETFEPQEKLNLRVSEAVSDLNRLNRRGVELRRAHRLRPGNCHILNELGTWYGQNQDRVRSLRYLKEAYRRCSKNPVIVLSLAWAYLVQGKRDEALKLSKWVLKQGLDEQYCNEALKVIELSDGPRAKE